MSGVVTPLHFLIEADGAGRPGVRTKLTCEQEVWSTYFYPLRSHPSVIDVSRIEGNNFKNVTAERIAEIKSDVQSTCLRMCMTSEVLNAIADEIKIIENPPNMYNWADAGRFVKENAAEHVAAIEAVEEEKAIRVELRPHLGIFNTAHARQTHEQQIIAVGKFVAVDMRNHHQSENDQLRFYVGKIRSIDPAIRKINVRWWIAVAEFDSRYRCYIGPSQYADVSTTTLSFLSTNLLLRPSRSGRRTRKPSRSY